MTSDNIARAEKITTRVLDLVGIAGPVVLVWLIIDTVTRPIKVSSDSRLGVREKAVTAIVRERVTNVHMLIAGSLLLRAMIDISFLADRSRVQLGVEGALYLVIPRLLAWSAVIGLFHLNYILFEWLMELTARRVIGSWPRLLITNYLVLALTVAAPIANLALTI